VNYQTTLQSWHDFYSITGGATASLVGLLFVGLSLHLRVVINHPDVRALARVTLTSFGVTLVLSLFMLVPETRSSSTGWNLVGLGSFACALITQSLVAGFMTQHRTLSVRHLILRFGLTTATFVAVIVVGAVMVSGDYTEALSYLVGVAIFLVVVSLRNSWDLLVIVGAATLGTQPVDGVPEQHPAAPLDTRASSSGRAG
jgi:cell division protein FtsW (lipid II flippase)